MPIINFNSQVLSAFGLAPLNLGFALSGGSGTPKTVELLTVGTIGGKQVEGIAFNALTSPASGTATTVTLSAFSGTTFRVNTAYFNTIMSIIFTDGSSSLFTVLTGTTQQTLTANGFDSIFPESRRKWLLGYI